MQYFLFFLVLAVILILIARPLTVLCHELGHAIPAILLTKEKVTIYIGSYGDPKKSIRYKLKLLEIYFRYNPFSWKLGLCVPSAKAVSINRQIIYTVTGPITSLIIATAACYIAFTYDMHGLLKLFLVLFFGSALLDLIVNLIPRNKPIKLYSGTITYNDGYKLKQLFYYKKFPNQYSKAIELYNQQKFLDAAMLFEKMLTDGIKHKDVYRLAINSYLQCKNYVKGKDLTEELKEIDELTSDDLSNLALCYSQSGLHEKALELYNESLRLNHNNKYSLNNKGFTLNLLNRYEEAIPLLDKAIEIDKDFAYSYNNRGLSKIKIGKTEEGLNDINYSFTLDGNNSYGYRNLGIYNLDKGNYEEALKLFIKANELDETTHLVKELIDEAKLHINNSVTVNKNIPS